jgi:alpha-methylacyl-CoA racemase
VIGAQPRAHWLQRAAGRDACIAPVLPMGEAPRHPQMAARATVVDVDGVPQPAPAPRFSATPAALDRPPALQGEHTDEVLADCGFDAAEVAALRAGGVLG